MPTFGGRWWPCLRPNCRVDGQVGKAVYLGVVGSFAQTLWVLVGRMAQLARSGPRHGRHVHPVVVDQLQGKPASGPRHQQDVAVLQVGMGYLGLAEPRGQLHPQVQQRAQRFRTVQVLPDEVIQGEPLAPTHLQKRHPLAAGSNARLDELEVHHEGKLRPLEVLADPAVAVAEAGGPLGETFDGLGVARGRAPDLVHIGEATRPHQRHAQRAAHRLALAQLLIADRRAEVLNRRVVFRRLRPTYEGFPSCRHNGAAPPGHENTRGTLDRNRAVGSQTHDQQGHVVVADLLGIAEALNPGGKTLLRRRPLQHPFHPLPWRIAPLLLRQTPPR